MASDLIAALARNAAKVNDPGLRLRLETAIAALRRRSRNEAGRRPPRGDAGRRGNSRDAGRRWG
jgi:hypothetical protein